MPRSGSGALRLTAVSGDLRSPNDRAQLNGEVIFHEGDNIYYRWSVFFPSNFSTKAGVYPGFFTFAEIIGPPDDGPSAFGTVSVAGGRELTWERGRDHKYDRPWSTPLVRGRWHDFVAHIAFSTSADKGLVELWYDGKKQKFTGGSTAIHMATLRSNNTRGVYPVVTNYRTAGQIPGPVTLYFDSVKVGRTYQSVTG